MNFCEKCNNLYGFINKTDDDDDTSHVLLKCQACGYTTDIKNDTVVYARRFVSKTSDMVPNPDVKYDHTLTRTSKVKCENAKCPTITGDYA